MAKFEVPDGWCVEAFWFTLEPTDDQSRMLARHFGARRKAYNWTVATRRRPTPTESAVRWTHTGNAMRVRHLSISVTTTLRSTSQATRKHLASLAQSGPPSSVEPTVRPGRARQMAMKRGRDAAARLPNNPEMGCESRDH
jgi:putative transposase